MFVDFVELTLAVFVFELTLTVLIFCHFAVRSSGCVIDTHDCNDMNTEMLEKLAESFQVSHVIVVASERIYNDVVGCLPPFVTVNYVPELPGVRSLTSSCTTDTMMIHCLSYKSLR
jgi:hypothetical protein